MSSKVFAWDEDVQLKSISLSQQVWEQLHPIERQKEAPLKTWDNYKKPLWNAGSSEMGNRQMDSILSRDHIKSLSLNIFYHYS